MTVSIAIATLLSTVSATDSVEERSFDAANLERLEVKTGAGYIHIRTIDSAQIVVTARKQTFDSGCELKMDATRRKLRLGVSKRSVFRISECRVDFEIGLPRRLDARLASGSGEIKIGAPMGKVEIKVGSGDVTITAPVEKLTSRAGNGDISATGMVGSADITTGSGNVVLKYPQAPEKASVRIKSGSGNATVYLPETTLVRISHKAGSGRMHTELPNQSSADFRIRMKAGSGNLYVKKL